jgi:hypothetical protein
MSEPVLREFVCRHCGHKIVVHPDFPPDEVPTCCIHCYDAVVRPGAERIMRDVQLFLRSLSD